MVWALQFDGVNDYGTFSTISDMHTQVGTAGWEYELRVVLSSSSTSVRLFGDGTTFSSYFFITESQTVVRQSTSSSSQVNIPHSTNILFDNLEHTIVVKRAGSAYTVHLDGFLIGTLSQGFTQGGNSGINRLMSIGGTVSSEVQLLELILRDSSGVDKYHWDATASSHAAGTPVLTDIIGGNNATGVNMPTDGSAWLDLGGGGISIAVTDNLTQPSVDSVTVSNISVLDLYGNTTQPSVDSMLITNIDQLVFSDNISQPSVDNLLITDVGEISLSSNITQVTSDVFAIENITQLSMTSNIRQLSVDSIAIEQVGYLSFSDNARSPTVDTLAIELYTILEFTSTIRQVTVDSIVLTTKTMPVFGNDDLSLIDVTVSYSLTDNSTDYKAI